MKKNMFRKCLVIGIIMLFVGTGTVGAKSLYTIAAINAYPTPIEAYNIESGGSLVFQKAYGVPSHAGGAVGIAIDSDSTTLFVTYEFTNVIQLLDARTMGNLGTTTAPGASNLAGIVVDQDKGLVYTVDRWTDDLYIYRWYPSSKTLVLQDVQNLADAPASFGIALDEVNDVLFVANYYRSVMYYNTNTWAKLGEFDVSHYPQSIAVDAENQFVYTGSGWSGSKLLSKYDLNTATETTLNIGQGITGMAVDPASNLLYCNVGIYIGSASTIRVFDSDLTQLFSTPFNYNYPSPTGLCIPSEKIGIHRPNADPGGPYNGNINEPVHLHGSGTAAKGRTIVAYEWTFDDSSKSTDKNPKHTWTSPGPHFAELRVKDNKNLWSVPKKCNVYVVEPFTFVHMTDTHIAKKNDESYGYLTDAIDEINRITPKPDFILVTGDLVDYAEVDTGGVIPNYVDSGNYKVFLEAFESLDPPTKVYPVPGNHDRYALTPDIPPFIPSDKSLTWYNHYIVPEIPMDYENLIPPDKNNYIFEHGGYLFVGLDSGYEGLLGMQGSALTDPQWSALIKLDTDKRKIIFMHHPTIDVDRLPDHRIKNLRPNFINYCKVKNVELVLAGHTHEDHVFNANNIEVPIGSNDRPLFIQTPAAGKDTEGFKHGYRIIDVTAEGAILHHYKKTKRQLYWRAAPECPVNLHVYDSRGKHTGLNISSGEVERNIPRSFYFSRNEIMSNETPNINGNHTLPETILLYNTSDDYQFKIVSNLTKEQRKLSINNSFNFTLEKQTDSFLMTISYFNVSLYENTTATLTVNLSITNYTMYIDYDGDNITDEEKYPDLIETNYAPNVTIISPINNSISLYGEEIEFNGTGTDSEDGVLTNSSLLWYSSINGYIGVGNRFNTSNLPEGTHTIELFVNDSSGQIATDNITLTVIAPDLTIDTSNISFSNPNPVESENITVNATIYNIGNKNATNITVQFYKSNFLNDTQIGSNQTIASLNVSENKTVSVIWNTTGSAGDNSIWVVVDPSDVIKESNEENNWAYKSVFVGASNLIHIVQANTDRALYLEGEDVLVSCLVQNASGHINASVIASIEKPDGVIENMTMIESSIGNYSRTFSNTYKPGLYNITIFANRTGFTGDDESLSFKILDTAIPSRITNLSNITGPTWINWSWDNPDESDFDHTLIYVNGLWKTATSKGYYLAEGLTPNSKYEIGIHTVDTAGNINGRWINQTTITGGNQPPVANASGPYFGYEGSPITFDASNSYDPEGDELQYRWDFDDDGSWDTEFSTTHNATYVWEDDYTGMVVLEVYDGDLTDIDSANVTVYNVAPTVSIDNITQPFPEFILTNDTLQINGSFCDPGTLDTHNVEWNFGDGNNSTGTLTPNHTFAEPGNYTITLAVGDDDGGTGNDSMIIHIETQQEAIEHIIQNIGEMNLPPWNNSLIVKLENAIDSLNMNNTIAAINKLEAFINEVEAKRGKVFTDEEADALIAATQWIIDNIENG